MKTDLPIHPFFKALNEAERTQKLGGPWGLGGKQGNKIKFFSALKFAHPFFFDRRVTIQKRLDGRGAIDLESLVEDFSLPFSTSLYLLNGAVGVDSPMNGGTTERVMTTMHGYLIHELTPETFQCYSVATVEFEGKEFPYIQEFAIDLMKLMTCDWHSIEDNTVEMHYMKEICSIMHFTKAISVQRIGIEHFRSWSMKSKGVNSLGFTAIKTDNLYHIADKREYDYKTPSDNEDIRWEYSGFWRGHWRAFYCKNSSGQTVRDRNGCNQVDYGKVGKNRQGKYCVPGYTWVTEHTKGDPALAEIKKRVVVAGPLTRIG